MLTDIQRITPNLWFDTQAEEAARFYISIFKDGKITNISRYGSEGPGAAGSVIVVGFELEGQSFAALNGGPAFSISEAVSFIVNCDTQADVDYYWDRLSEGGDERAQMCGWLKDRFGVSWQIVPTALPRLLTGADPEGARRAMQAMLKMKKLDVDELQRAYDGIDGATAVGPGADRGG
jgi:predicted 3-demethylubiquinone-9 3-methyltransferase (glyoxalase superfamily)